MTLSSEILQQLKNWCQKQPVKLSVLFGSQATGRANPHSDVDLAIWPAKTITTRSRLRWVGELEILLNRDVNLVWVSADLDPVLGMEIFRQGQLIYEREPELWVHYRLQLWHRYNDSLPFLRAARRQLHQFAEEVRRGS